MNMEKETKNLIVRDLCGRIPFGVVMRNKYGVTAVLHTLNASFGMFELEAEPDSGYELGSVLDWKPCLRPMSSMTEDERNEMKKMLCPTGTGSFDEEGLIVPMSHFGDKIHYDFMSRILEWLNARHFDHNGLIASGLAIEVNEFFNPYK